MNMVSSGISMSGILKIGQPLVIVAVGAVVVVSTVDITPLKSISLFSSCDSFFLSHPLLFYFLNSLCSCLYG